MIYWQLTVTVHPSSNPLESTNIVDRVATYNRELAAEHGESWSLQCVKFVQHYITKQSYVRDACLDLTENASLQQTGEKESCTPVTSSLCDFGVLGPLQPLPGFPSAQDAKNQRVTYIACKVVTHQLYPKIFA